MRSRTSFFNKTVYAKTLSRFWPIWLGGTALWFLMEPMGFVNWVNNPMRKALTLRFHVVSAMCAETHIIWFIFSMAVAAAVFSWLYNTRSVGFTAALPLTRSNLFWSSYLAGLTMLVSALLFNAGIMLGISLFYGAGAEKLIFQWILESLLDILGFYGFGVLCAMLTGNLVIMPLVMLVLSFTAVVVEELVGDLMAIMLFGFKSSGGVLSYASPVWTLCRQCSVEYIHTAEGVVEDYAFNGMGLVAIYGLLGVLCTLLALQLMKKRRMETAGDTVAIGVLKPVFRWCMALGCALVLSVVIYELTLQGRYVPCKGPYLAFILALLLGGGLVGWYGADMLITKSFRVFRLHSKGAALAASLLLVFGLSLGFDAFGLEKTVPDREDFDSAALYCAGEEVLLDEEESLEQVMKLHGSIIGHKADHERSAVDQYELVRIEYYRDGKNILSRMYYLAADKTQRSDRNSDLRFTERVLNLSEAILERKRLDMTISEHAIGRAALSQWGYHYPENEEAYAAKYTRGIEDKADVSVEYFGACPDFSDGEWRLSPREAYELYTECILPDLQEGTLGRVWLVQDEEYAKSIYNVQFQMDLDTEDEKGNRYSQWFYTVPTIHSRRTNAWLEEHGVVLETYWDYLERMGGLDTLA